MIPVTVLAGIVCYFLLAVLHAHALSAKVLQDNLSNRRRGALENVFQLFAHEIRGAILSHFVLLFGDRPNGFL